MRIAVSLNTTHRFKTWPPLQAGVTSALLHPPPLNSITHTPSPPIINDILLDVETFTLPRFGHRSAGGVSVTQPGGGLTWESSQANQ